MQFAPDAEIQKISTLVEKFFEHVLCDEEPLFVSDEATIWDVSTVATADELIQRLQHYYGRVVSVEELKLPLWRLILQLTSPEQDIRVQ
jgi:hypothetical protein